ncbi:hypothetical protein HKD37_12G033950 [Glycine soja]|uniref:Uncharacterized protein n=1 Tax=Glycine max TaxID=3847 RepID=C6TE60_SOYBN|nr:unknown [Glycine max]
MCVTHLLLPPLRRHNHFSASPNTPHAIRSQPSQQPRRHRFSPRHRQTLRTHPRFHCKVYDARGAAQEGERVA